MKKIYKKAETLVTPLFASYLIMDAGSAGKSDGGSVIPGKQSPARSIYV